MVLTALSRVATTGLSVIAIVTTRGITTFAEIPTSRQYAQSAGSVVGSTSRAKSIRSSSLLGGGENDLQSEPAAIERAGVPTPLPAEERCRYNDISGYDPTSSQCNNGMPTIPEYLLPQSLQNGGADDLQMLKSTRRTLPDYHRRKVVPDLPDNSTDSGFRFSILDKDYTRDATMVERKLDSYSPPSLSPRIPQTTAPMQTERPTMLPTEGPTVLPTEMPSNRPKAVIDLFSVTEGPTEMPSNRPKAVIDLFSVTEGPTVLPTDYPTDYPYYHPSYNPPTDYPNYPTEYPIYPTDYPIYPTDYPIYPTEYPSIYPSGYPNYHPPTNPPADIYDYPTGSPTVLPTENNEPTDYPIYFASEYPPTEYPYHYPTNPPTEYPYYPTNSSTLNGFRRVKEANDSAYGTQSGGVPKHYVNNKHFHCDFSFLDQGVVLSDVDQSDLMTQSCFLTVTGTQFDTTGSRQITVVNLINFTNPDPQHPCGGDSNYSLSYKDCEAEAKALVLYSEGDDETTHAGCMNFEFDDPVDLAGMKIVGLPHEGSAKVTITNADGIDMVIVSPEQLAGTHTPWLVHETHPSFRVRTAVVLSVCSPVASAVAFIDFYEAADPDEEPLYLSLEEDITLVSDSQPMPFGMEGSGQIGSVIDPHIAEWYQEGERSDSDLSSKILFMHLPGAEYRSCDFSALTDGALLSEVDQSDILAHTCSFTVSGTNEGSFGSRQVAVLDTANILNGLWDLGSPNYSCGGQVNVTGAGGSINGPYPNCVPQGNALYLDVNMNNEDQSDGGCLNIEFNDPVDLVGMGILNVPDQGFVTITTTDVDGQDEVMKSPEHAGANSFWAVKAKSPFILRRGVVLVSVCSPISSALTNLDFFTGGDESKREEVSALSLRQAKDAKEAGRRLSSPKANRSVSKETATRVVDESKVNLSVQPASTSGSKPEEKSETEDALLQLEDLPLSDGVSQVNSTVQPASTSGSTREEKSETEDALLQLEDLPISEGVSQSEEQSDSNPSAQKSFMLLKGAEYIVCDFAFLTDGEFLSDVDQSDLLEHFCSFTATGAYQGSFGSRQVSIVDTGKIQNGLWNIGSPNYSCGGHTNVTGFGGIISSPFSNCNPQGKALVLEVDTDNDHSHGGCLNLEFRDPVDLVGMGILDIPLQGFVTITMTDVDGEDEVMNSPENAGPNSLWVVNATSPFILRRGVVLVSICSPVSSALTFITFYQGGDEIERQEVSIPIEIVDDGGRQKEKLIPFFEESRSTPIVQFIPSPCSKYKHCDFTLLSDNLFVSDVEQTDLLLHSCAFTLTGSNVDNVGSRQINVLDTSNIRNGLWDLGAPHSSCAGHVNVSGSGGQMYGEYPNCQEQGKVVYVEESYSENELGGCINVEFEDPVDILGMGLLNFPEEGSVKITITDSDGADVVVLSPDDVGTNSFWVVNQTNPTIQQRRVVLMSICSPATTALAYLDFYLADEDCDGKRQVGVESVESFDQPVETSPVEVAATSPDEDVVEMCDGPGVKGFYLVDRNGKEIPGFQQLQHGQVIQSTALPQNGVDLAIHHGIELGAVKYETEQWGDVYESNYPYRVNKNNFHLPGKYTLKVYAFSDTEFSTHLNTCEIQFDVI